MGYFLAGGLTRGSTVYVTTERIIVNKGRGQLSLRAHFLVTLLVLFAPVVPAIAAEIIILAVVGIVVFLLVKRKSFRRKLFTIENAEKGHRQLEVKRGHVLRIELRPPGRFRSGYLVITSLSSEPFSLKILGGRVFKIARSLMVRFEATKVGVLEGQPGSIQSP
jgi:hypothetical protein